VVVGFLTSIGAYRLSISDKFLKQIYFMSTAQDFDSMRKVQIIIFMILAVSQ
jgi:hypothetical protein